MRSIISRIDILQNGYIESEFYGKYFVSEKPLLSYEKVRDTGEFDYDKLGAIQWTAEQQAEITGFTPKYNTRIDLGGIWKEGTKKNAVYLTVNYPNGTIKEYAVILGKLSIIEQVNSFFDMLAQEVGETAAKALKTAAYILAALLLIIIILKFKK